MYIGSEFPKRWFYHQNAGCPAGFRLNEPHSGPLTCINTAGQLVDWSDADWRRAKQADNQLSRAGWIAAASIALFAPGPWKLLAVVPLIVAPRSSW